MSRPGVLIIGNLLSANGASRAVCADLAVRLAELGHPVTAASTRPQKALRIGDMLATTWRSRHTSEVALVDVFSGSAFVWAESVCWLLRKMKKPFILTLHGGNLPEFARRHPARVRRLLQAATMVTSPSAYLQRALAAFREEIVNLPNPVDVVRYPFRMRGATVPRLMWLRSFHSIYNPTLAPKVLKLVREKYPEARLTMVGGDREPGMRAATLAEAGRLGVADACDLRGPVPKADVPSVLCEADIFLNTTNIDNTPVSVIEAMACGLCVVSTDVGGMRDLATHRENALLVPPGDERAMANAVLEILESNELAAQLSRNGRSLAESCDWSTILPRWEDLIQQCVAGGVR
jgi:glycosyltransferase involved in cell wall biosynthesis